jgi:hypothetical protein
MFEKLEAYLEEISHFLSDPGERKEILSEIRSHILEKAEQEYGQTTEASLSKVIAAYGPARHVAEKYLDGRAVIAPVYHRYLFRYTVLFFAFHFVLTVVAVVFKMSFLIFPFLYMPPMGPFEALLYLPTAFLFDLGAVTLILYLVTQSKKEIKLPWPRFSIDIDEVKPSYRKIPRIIWLMTMVALTGVALYFYARYRTIFLVSFNFGQPQPIFTPQAGQWYSLIVIGLWAISSIGLAIKLLISSPWVDAIEKGLSLVLLGLVFRQPFDTVWASPLPVPFNQFANLGFFKLGLTIALLALCILVGKEFIKALVRIGRKNLAT